MEAIQIAWVVKFPQHLTRVALGAMFLQHPKTLADTSHLLRYTKLQTKLQTNLMRVCFLVLVALAKFIRDS